MRVHKVDLLFRARGVKSRRVPQHIAPHNRDRTTGARGCDTVAHVSFFLSAEHLAHLPRRLGSLNPWKASMPPRSGAASGSAPAAMRFSLLRYLLDSFGFVMKPK